MRKKVEFFKVDYSFMPMVEASKPDSELKNEILDKIKSCADKEPKYIKESIHSSKTRILIEALDVTDEYLFGTISKLDEMKEGELRRFREKDSHEVVEDIEGSLDCNIEHYTYFYIRFVDLKCAVMSNSSAPKFRMHFTNYLNDITESLSLDSLNVINVYDERIEEKINRVVELSELSMVFDDSSVIGQRLVDLKDSFSLSQSGLKEARVKLTFEMQTLSDESRKLLQNNEVLKSDFKRLEMIGVDDDDREVNAELIEKLLTKKISIQLDENCLTNSDNLDKIKKALSESF